MFQREVIDRFAEAYARGLTPNPCLDCNRRIKFSLLGDRAARMNCDFIATGHYARSEFEARRGRWLLRKARDQAKDQSYALYGLTQAQLARTLFPLGELDKIEVRGLAAARGLVNADKPDSQDICFVRGGDYASFLEKTMGLANPPGDFIDREGRVLGRHRGLIRYTVGQRRGLGSFGRPLYVTGLNPADNTVRLGPESELFSSAALVGEVNLISEETLDRPLTVDVKIRYNSLASPAVIEPHAAGLLVKFATPRQAVAPGQAAVFYQDDLLVGGGVILKSSCP
jgi:tRNA-specific 2-thiouridylase